MMKFILKLAIYAAHAIYDRQTVDNWLRTISFNVFYSTTYSIDNAKEKYDAFLAEVKETGRSANTDEEMVFANYSNKEGKRIRSLRRAKYNLSEKKRLKAYARNIKPSPLTGRLVCELHNEDDEVVDQCFRVDRMGETRYEILNITEVVTELVLLIPKK